MCWRVYKKTVSRAKRGFVNEKRYDELEHDV